MSRGRLRATYGRAGENEPSPVVSSPAELSRIARAAETHSWTVSVVATSPAVMATRESGRIGEPWVVMAVPGGRGLRVSFFQPGDALDFVVQDNGEVLIRPATEDIRRLKGLLHRSDRSPVSVAQMNQTIRNRGRKVQ